MAFMFNGTQANVTVNGTLNSSYPINATGQVNKEYAAGKAGVAIVAGAGITPYTVTVGKVFYMTSLSVSGGNVGFELRDGTIAGALKFSSFVAAGNIQSGIFIFPTPIKFSTAVFLDVTGNTTLQLAFNGYEA